MPEFSESKGKSRILLTGTAGFIGHHLSLALADLGYIVDGLDNINNYYDVDLKYGRLKDAGFDIGNIEHGVWLQNTTCKNLRFIKYDLADREGMEGIFRNNSYDTVINLAAQAGVRYSLENPHTYLESNITGFLNVLEGCRNNEIPLIYASSSSVYGANSSIPFSENDRVDHPLSLYAATKRTDELMAGTYNHLYGFQTIGLRFFTVYGPWGRPDMAYFMFTRAILDDKPIKVFNNGNMKRDFTYIDDIVRGISGLLDKQNTGTAEAELFNIGNSSPVNLMDFISILENELGRTAVKDMMPMQDGDVPATWADVSSLKQTTGYSPSVDLEEGIPRFVEWYKSFYGAEV